jgi:hypothetical protein
MDETAKNEGSLESPRSGKKRKNKGGEENRWPREVDIMATIVATRDLLTSSPFSAHNYPLALV